LLSCVKKVKIKALLEEEIIVMDSRCPSQDGRNLRVELYKCPNCGAEVEIFSDELKVKCHQCGKYIYKEKMPSCIDWCASARQCLGEERWKAFKGDSK